MFVNQELQNHLETSSTVKANSLIIAEWNMNIAENIAIVGNYRYRPTEADSNFSSIAQSFNFDDRVNNFYTGATDADILIDGGTNNEDVPTAFLSKKEKEKMLYSLEDCFGKFRPRSGINKLRYFDGQKYSHFSHPEMASRPRYYMSSNTDTFKYWTSFRTEVLDEESPVVERGIANINIDDTYYINDAAPFVVYEEAVPANRVVVKMQTNVGSTELGPFIFNDQQSSDPFFGQENQTTPVRWKIQYLDTNDTWVSAVTFDENSIRSDSSPVIGSDGYVEISYGLKIPESYRANFDLVQDFVSENLLPDPTYLPNGTAYKVLGATPSSLGTIHVVRNQASQDQGVYATFTEDYGWQLYEEDPKPENLVRRLSPPSSYVTATGRGISYKEFSYIKGIRIVVDTMNVFDSTFDLIEMSPRLIADVSENVVSFNVTKSASDLGITGLPVGQLLASVGGLRFFDSDQAFFDQNTESIVSGYTTQNIQFKFYEKILDVSGKNYYVPIKTMYSEDFPVVSNKERFVDINLRDLYFYFESLSAPQILIPNVSLSYAVSILLDSIGFSNYVFFRNENEKEDIIPYFFVPPETTIAEVLSQLAVSTQSAMFFDEYNNFVVMSKNYLLPNEVERETNLTLYGSNDFNQEGAVKNKTSAPKIANILDISFKNNSVFNGGKINYTTRSIQRTYGSLQQSLLLDRSKNWLYKPALLWEVTGSEVTRSTNEEAGSQTAYALSAIPLNSDLSALVPTVLNNRIINNTMDFGDSAVWVGRYNGYFFANGEVIKYDAVQYSIPGLSVSERDDPNVIGDNVWISSLEEYQNYFSKIPFNGKMYPTGLVRIYAEPNYEVVNGVTFLANGPVAKHGRGQFGTEIVEHPAGVASEWLSQDRLIGCNMDSRFIFEEEVVKLAFANATLKENATQAVFQIQDASLISEGDYLKFAQSVESDNTNNFINTDNNEITSVDTENNLVSIASRISFLNEKYFTAFESASAVNFVVSQEPITINIPSPVANLNIEVGMYAQIKDSSNIYFDCLVQEVNEDPEDANATIVTLSKDPLNSGTYFASEPATGDEEQGEASVSPGDPFVADLEFGKIVFPSVEIYEKKPSQVLGKAGIDSTISQATTRTDLIKNIFVSPFIEETASSIDNPATTQASALIVRGSVKDTEERPRDFISTIYKPLNKKFNHFGTRLRIVGSLNNDDARGQTPEGSESYFNASTTSAGQSPSIYGSSGGIAVMLNPETNNGYYFEISSLSESNPTEYDTASDVYNVTFYRLDRSADASFDSDKAIPSTLFGGQAEINVDSGIFAGQGRLANDKIVSVYDVSVEYQDVDGVRRFYLYLNNQNIAIVDDPNPLPAYNNMGLFVRGNSKLMFENVYALTGNYSQDTTFDLDTPVRSVFGVPSVSSQASFQKYAMSGLIQSTYLAGLSTLQPPKYNIYYNEFGTIMREAAYFDVRYDKAYPALLAKISPTFNRVKGYTVSGFIAGAYRAEFLVFNHTDTTLTLDSASGNYLRIQGVTFTQESTHELTVDEYFEKVGNFADPIFVTDRTVKSPLKASKKFTDIKLSRISQGQKDFSIDAPYLQTQDAANNMMGWLVDKIMKPRKSVGIRIFPMPTLQLGDIVKINYVGQNNFSEISNADTRFVVYNITYSKDVQGPSMEVYLSEVV